MISGVAREYLSTLNDRAKDKGGTAAAFQRVTLGGAGGIPII